jgi:hypothetical protein
LHSKLLLDCGVATFTFHHCAVHCKSFNLI